MSIENLDSFINKMNQLSGPVIDSTIKAAIGQGGIIVQKQAKQLSKGSIARSIMLKTTFTNQQADAIVYTNLEYSAYREFGTGPNGQDNHVGISPVLTPRYTQKGWMIPADALSLDQAEEYGLGIVKKSGTVIGYYTKGQMARPFMYPALKDKESVIVKNTSKIMQSAIGKVKKK